MDEVLNEVRIARGELAALRESEQRFRTICEHAPVMIDAFDENGRLILWNRECERQLGFTFEDMQKAEDPLVLAYPDSSVRARVKRNIERGDGQFREYRVCTRDGRERLQLWADFKLPTGASIAVGYDVTDERAAAEELAASQQQLRQVQKMDAIGQLSGGLAHDFNNLLTVVMTNLDLARRRVRDDVVLERLSDAHAASERGAELVRKLMRFGRAERLSIDLCDLCGIIEDMAPTLRRLLPETLDIQLELQPDVPAVRVDSGAIEQILFNLATNARDATGGWGTIRIGTAVATLGAEQQSSLGINGGRRIIAMTFTDDGMGMDEATRERALEPFFTTKPVGKGTGLGLAMVYGLVRQHGGAVTLASEVDRGTTVTVYLPSGAPAGAPDGSRPAGPALGIRPASREATVLLVEDEAPLRAAVVSILEEAGYIVIEAADGAEAMEIFARQAANIDLVVSDAVMPKLTGTALFERLRALGHEPRFLLITGHLADTAAVPAGLPLLFKPWSAGDLLDRIARLLDDDSPDDR